MATPNWSIEGLQATVEAYVNMPQMKSEGEPFSQKAHYVGLATCFGRTKKAYEYRMQNISYVYELQGRRWVNGLPQARDVGRNVLEVSETLIENIEGQKFNDMAVFNSQVEPMLMESRSATSPVGNEHPATVPVNVSQFIRNSAIATWVLKTTKEICDYCPGHHFQVKPVQVIWKCIILSVSRMAVQTPYPMLFRHVPIVIESCIMANAKNCWRVAKGRIKRPSQG